MQLVDALATDPQGRADGGEGLGVSAGQAVVGDDHLTPAGRQLPHEGAQGSADLSPLEALAQVGVGGREETGAEVGPRGLRPRGGDRVPDRVGDRRDRVGAEAGAAGRIVTAQGVPQAEAPGVQGIGEGEGAAPLLADDPADQPVVAGHLLVERGVREARRGCARVGHHDTSGGRGVVVRPPEVSFSSRPFCQLRRRHPFPSRSELLFSIRWGWCSRSHPLRMPCPRTDIAGE